MMKKLLYTLTALLLPLMAAGANPNDLYSQYKAGEDIKIGDLVVNKTTYPDAQLVAPEDLTFSGHISKGGLYFIDDKEGTGVANLSAKAVGRQSPAATATNPLIVIGRYKVDGKQTEIKVSEMRTRGDVAFMNVKLTAKQAAGESNSMFNMFAKNSSDQLSTAIRLQDCSVDNVAARNFILDKQNEESAPYSKVMLDNCVVKLAREKGNFVVALYRCEGVVEDPTEFSITNSVVYASAPAKYATVFHATKNTLAKKLTLTGNSFVNLGGGQGVVKHAVVESAAIGSNLIALCFNAAVDLGYDSGKFIFSATDEQPKLVSAGNNYIAIYGEAVYDSRPYEFGYWQFKSNKTDRIRRNDPFKTYNVENACFVVNPEVVTNGAGASYETKYFVSK